MLNQNGLDGCSIIIPTYQEVKNITRLVERIKSSLSGATHFEVILVDDNSQDGIEEVVNHLKKDHPWLHLIVRSSERSWAKSVMEGIHYASRPLLIFMDADLSHPPETIPLMLKKLEQENVDMVIGSRYTKGGSIDKKWPLYRKIISRLSTIVIKPLLPIKINDPLSGFIAVKKDSYLLNGPLWDPIGAKLTLEIIVKSKIKNIQEIPIHFAEREQGESKLLNYQMILKYIRQVKNLWQFKLFGA